MITYKSSDILKRASQLADLENSSFISWNENINLLNEAYRKLYQIVIDNNDKYYLRTLKISELVHAESFQNENRYYLPEDFYQLCTVTIGADKTPLLRKSAAESVTSKRYDIINDCIVFYGGVEQLEVEINYYPSPKTLTTFAPDKKLDPITDTILDCNNNGFLCINEEGSVYVYNVAKGSATESVEVGIEPDEIIYALLGRKYAAIATVESTYFVNLVDGSFVDIGLSFKCAKKDNELYFIEKMEDNTFTIYKESNYSGTAFQRVYAENINITFPEGYSFSTPDVWTFTDDFSLFYIPYQQEGDFLRLWECSEEAAEKSYEVSEWSKNTIIKGNLYFTNYDIFVDGIKIVSDADFYSLIGFNKADCNTGYGVSVINDDGDLVVKSVFTDTELNFPSNFYFNYMAYMLAVSYKTKQNADSSGLIALADAEELAFYDTLNRDVSNTTRINNVYTYNGGNW